MQKKNIVVKQKGNSKRMNELQNRKNITVIQGTCIFPSIIFKLASTGKVAKPQELNVFF